MLLYRFDGNSSRLKALNHSVHKPPTWDPLNRLEVGRVHFRPIQWAPDSGFVYTSVQGPFMIKLILLHSAGLSPPESVAPSFVQKFHPLEFFSVGKKKVSPIFLKLWILIDSDRGH